MSRAVGLVALLVCVCLVAGCGGSSLQRTALDYASQFTVGRPHPTSVRTEYVQDVGGMREAVVFLHGHFRLRRECQNPVAPCPKGSPRASTIMIDMSLPDPKASWGFATQSPSQVAALAAAKNASPLFTIFADFTNPAIRCAIPRGNASATIAGACVTLFEPGSGEIKFRERWPFAKTRDGHWRRGEKTGGWIVAIGRNGRVHSVRVFGDLPPQLWK